MVPPVVRHLLWMHPGRRTAMVHLLPQHARDDGEEGLVSFTSGVDYRRTEFHGIYVYNRVRPPYNDTLFLQFRYLGELHNDLLIDHHLVATSPIDPFTYRNTGGHAIVAQVTTEDVGYMYMDHTDSLYP